MKRKKIAPKITHVMADGRVLSDEEFMSKPFVIRAEDNIEFLIKANQVLDPNYWEKERRRRKWERAEQRKAELEAQQAAIAREMRSLTT